MGFTEQIFGQLPPQALDEERALLGSVMLDGDRAILEAMDAGITIDDFYLEQHRILFRGMLELSQQRQPIDVLTIRGQIGGKEVLERIGGDAYLADLARYVPTASHVRQYANVVHEKALLRNFIQVTVRMVQDAMDCARDGAAEFLDHAAASILAACQGRSKSKILAVNKIIPDVLERMRYITKTKTPMGLCSGLKDLDKAVGGFEPQTMTVVAGRPGTGKSVLGVEILQRLARAKNEAVILFSCEMSSSEIVSRMLCAEAHVNLSQIRTGGGNASDIELLEAAAERLSTIKFYIDDSPGISPMQVRNRVRQIQQLEDGKIAAIGVDYLQLMRPDRRHENEQTAVTEISQSLKHIAKEIDCPVIALAQLNRDLERREDKRPKLADLRSSGAIEQDADAVLMLYRDDMYHKNAEPNVLEVGVEKQRNGTAGVFFRLRFFMEELRIESYASPKQYPGY